MTAGIKIYVEGANVESKEAKASLRNGLDALLVKQKTAARIRRLHWDVVFCGGRAAACEAFKNSLKDDGRVAVLLVDSESAISNETGTLTRWLDSLIPTL